MQALIKYFGAILILVSGTMIGWFISWAYLKRIKDLQSFRSAVNIIDNEISSKRQKLADVMYNTGNRVDAPLQNIFLEIVEYINKNPDKEFYEIWLEVLNKNKDKYFFSDRDLQIINEWASQIGRIPLEKQIKINNACIKEINTNIREAKTEAEKKVKMFRYFGILISLFIIIIFY